MKTTLIIQLPLIIFFQTLHFTVAQNSFPIFRCRTSNNFTTNTVYQANIETALASVSLEVTKHYGFNKTPAGESPNIVTGVALCRGDIGLETCQTCVNDSHILLRKNCPTRIEALVWTANCMLLYSNSTYISTFYNRPYGKILSHVNVSNIVDYNVVLRDLAGKLRTKAASGNSLRKFATGDAVYGPDSTKVYALMQCAPDLSSFDCNSCLSVVFREAQGCCDGDIDVAVIFPACFIRYSNVSFYNDPPAISLPAALPPSSTSSPATNGGKRNSSKIIYVVVPVAFVSVGLSSIVLCLFVKKTRRKKNNTGILSVVEMEMSTVGSLKYDLSTIEAATNNFFDDNKIGEGGFGPVYKGVLANGTEVAVKRLSKSSGQGSHEFVTEVILMAKLQHRNLVRLLGFCLEDEERILIYEFVPNKSLDHFIFDPNRQGHLDWVKRYKIIEGIARGMLYLHHDSRLRIIHRDLKTSNVLLDQDMNAKISDFGLARIFGVDQTQASTNRIVGTYGYMSPEYAVHGQLSVKSDVFAFGVPFDRGRFDNTKTRGRVFFNKGGMTQLASKTATMGKTTVVLMTVN